MPNEQELRLLARRCSANVDLAIQKLEQIMKGERDASLSTEKEPARQSRIA